MVGSGRIEDAPVPADDDQPAHSVSPDAPIVGASSVTFGVLPRRTKPCPSHGNPFTSFSLETSVRWFGGGLRIVRAICRPVSVTLMRALSSSSRPHQKPVPTGVTPPDRSVLVCASGAKELDAEWDHFTSTRLDTESRVHPARMTYQPRPQTGVCKHLSAFLNVQSHHLDLFLKRPGGTFRGIRPTVLPRRSFQDNQIRKNLSFFCFKQVSPSRFSVATQAALHEKNSSTNQRPPSTK